MGRPSHDEFSLEKQKERLEEITLWLNQNMPKAFYDEISLEDRLLMASELLTFKWQEHWVQIQCGHMAYCLSLNTCDAEIITLSKFKDHEIRDYRSFVSTAKLTPLGINARLRIVSIHFLEADYTEMYEPLDKESKENLWTKVQARNPHVRAEDLHEMLDKISHPFLNLLSEETISITLDLLLKARTDTYCEFETLPEFHWQTNYRPSMQVIIALRQVPQNHFLYLLAKLIKRHNLFFRRVNSTYVDPYSSEGYLLVVIAIHGADGSAAWDASSIPEFLQELTMLKMLPEIDEMEKELVNTGVLQSNMAHLLRAISVFAHQMLSPIDNHLYSFDNVRESFIRHPELSALLSELFELRFHPLSHNMTQFKLKSEQAQKVIQKLDTGHPQNDQRRKNVFSQALNFIEFTQKTNFFRPNKLGLGFRINPEILNHLPYSREVRFPELPFSIFFVRGTRSFGFHIRFRDLSRGGLRTILPQKEEQLVAERTQVFTEAYNLAYTQQKKNKDIPEGGSKGVLLLHPFSIPKSEHVALERGLTLKKESEEEVEETLAKLYENKRLAYLHYSQKCFIDSLLVLINCHKEGKLKARHIIDYYGKPEYIYMGPDENMHNSMIEWIAEYSKKHEYRPGAAFISSHPKHGINHKEFGVTSYGVHFYVKEVLNYLGIDPETESFTVKMSGGPDGDVAGNQILNLLKDFPHTAKLLALTDVSGTINDPEGLDLEELAHLFHTQKAINCYPPQKLHEGGFLLDKQVNKEDEYSKLTLCWRMKDSKLIKDWVSGSEMNYLYRHNVHKTPADLFIPAGGRPRTLSSSNIEDFLNEEGHPTSKAIVEGANLYFTNEARKALEELGVLIFKDSSANKGGVMSSSMEVLYGLLLDVEEFETNKPVLVRQILETISQKALSEGRILLKEHKKTKQPLTELSETLSAKINIFTDQLFTYLSSITLPEDENHPYNQAIINYCPPFLREQYKDRILQDLPTSHKKAIIACHLACQLVYQKGLDWAPTLINALPLILAKDDMVGAFTPPEL